MSALEFVSFGFPFVYMGAFMGRKLRKSELKEGGITLRYNYELIDHCM